MPDAPVKVDYRPGVLLRQRQRVERILNRDGAAICPMEQRALGLSDPAAAFALFDEVIP